jgi:hypothetical protein
MKDTQVIDIVIDGLTVVAPFLANVARVAATIQQAQAEGRPLTQEEIDAARAITAAKRAMLEAS